MLKTSFLFSQVETIESLGFRRETESVTFGGKDAPRVEWFAMKKYGRFYLLQVHLEDTFLAFILMFIL